MRFFKINNDLGYKKADGYDDKIFTSIKDALKFGKNDLYQYIKYYLLSIELPDDEVNKYIRKKKPIFCITMYDTGSYIFDKPNEAKLTEINKHMNLYDYNDLIYSIWYEKLFYIWEEKLVDAIQTTYFTPDGDCRCYLDFENRKINGTRFKVGDKVEFFDITYKNTYTGTITEVPNTIESYKDESGSWWANVYKIMDDGEEYGVYESAITKI